MDIRLYNEQQPHEVDGDALVSYRNAVDILIRRNVQGSAARVRQLVPLPRPPIKPTSENVAPINGHTIQVPAIDALGALGCQ